MVAPLQINFPPVIDNPAVSDAALGVLDLLREDFVRAGTEARIYRSELTAHDPSTSYPAIHGRLVKVLRDILVQRDFVSWTSPGGLAAVRHPDMHYQITVAVGTAATGLVDRTPSNLWGRGPETERAFGISKSNALRKRFPGMESLPNPDLFVFLVNIDASGELRMELSKPSEFRRRHFLAWEWRIIIPPYVDATGATLIKPKSSGGIWTPDIEIQVHRREDSA